MSSNVRRDLLFLYRSAISAVSGDKVLPNILNITPQGLLKITPSAVYCASPVVREYDLKTRRLLLIGAGKSVLGLAYGFLEYLDSYNKQQGKSISIDDGILSVTFGLDVTASKTLFDRFNVKLMFGAKNNIPDECSVQATKSIVELLESLSGSKQNYLVLNFISGGGSALLSLPKAGITLERKRQIIDNLIKVGSTIQELNKVRRVLSDVKGGKLLQKIKNPKNVEIITFIASDIIGDPVDLVASGPTVPVTGDAVSQAVEVIQRKNLKLTPDEMKIIKQSEENQNDQAQVNNFIVVSNTTALSEVTNIASSKLGYDVVFLGGNISGEAGKVAVNLSNTVRNYKSLSGRNVLFLGGGETTVTFDPESFKPGAGGRCQEMALAFYTESFSWNENITFMAVGTDGQDGPTPVAGVITSSGGLNLITRDEDAARILADCSEGLKYHDSYNFWKKNDPDCLVETGPTGVNVMDLYCFVKENQISKL